jgi:AsmA protein
MATMKKFLKYGLLVAAGVLVILAAGAAYLLATFDPNAYKPQIIQAVKSSKQRNLKLNGDIKLTFFPNIGASFGKASLSEFRSEQEFASIDSAHVSVALLPLFARQVVVDKVAVSGMTVHLIKHKDGKLNIDDLLSTSASPAPVENKLAAAGGAPVKFDIAAVSVDKTELSYRDEATGAQYAVKDLHLETGRIANGVPTNIGLAANIQANRPKLDITAQLKTDLVFDLEKNSYQLTNLDLEARGSAIDINNLSVKASGNANAKLGTQEFGVKKFSLSASGVQAKNNFGVKLDAPLLALTNDKFSGDKLALNAKLEGPAGNVTADMALPGVEGNRQSFKISALTLDADMAQPDQSFKVKLSTPVSGNIEAQQFSLPNLTLAISAHGDKLPNKSVSSELKGNVKLDLKKQTAAANLAGGLLQSNVKADVAVNGFTNPSVRFNADLDQFDADLYLPKKSKGTTAAMPPAAAAEQPFDLSALKKLDLDGNLRVGALKAANVKTSQLRVEVKVHRGLVNINPLSANLYQGSLKGNVTVNAAQATPSFAVNAALKGVDVGPLARDAADLDVLEGKGTVMLKLNTQGDTVSTLKKRLNGNAALNVASGAIKGINLAKLVESVQSLGKNTSVQTLGINKDEKTPFSEFKASFKVRDGVAHNDDLSVRSTMLRINGNGDIDIGHDNVNYDAKVAFARTEQGRTATLPVNVSGPFDNLKFKVDYTALFSDLAKQKIEEKEQELKAKAVEDAKAKLREQLKGLFK